MSDNRGGTDPFASQAKMFDGFFSGARMSSTYKPVFLRALVDVGKWDSGEPLVGREWIRDEGSAIRVELDFAAARFASFYWDIVVGFSMRHAPERMASRGDQKEDAVNIVRLITDKVEEMQKAEACRAIMSASAGPADMPGRAADAARRALAETRPPTLAELASAEMAPFRREVISKAVRPEVLVHLQTDMPDLYEVHARQDSIGLDPQAVRYMGQACSALKTALNYTIARRLEEFNPTTRHIAVKIDGDMSYEDRIRKVKALEARALEARQDVAPLHKISSELTAGLEKLALQESKRPAIGGAGQGAYARGSAAID